MRSLCCYALAALTAAFVLSPAARAQNVPAPASVPAVPRSEAGCASFEEFIHTDCPLTWHGITLYGTYDVGVGWVSHGMPQSPYNYEGQSLINRNANLSFSDTAPTEMSHLSLRVGGSLQNLRSWTV